MDKYVSKPSEKQDRIEVWVWVALAGLGVLARLIFF